MIRRYKKVKLQTGWSKRRKDYKDLDGRRKRLGAELENDQERK